MRQSLVKTVIIFSLFLTAFASCMGPTKEKTKDTASERIILPNPNDSLVLYFNEDMGYATEKIVHAYKLTGTPQRIEEWNNSISRDYITGYHNCYTIANDSITVEYHLICSYDSYGNRRDNWFGYLSVGITCTKNNAFETLQTITNDLNNSYKNHQNYLWDEEIGQWTNGMQNVYIQPPTRNEEKGSVYCAICVMPIDFVHK